MAEGRYQKEDGTRSADVPNRTCSLSDQLSLPASSRSILLGAIVSAVTAARPQPPLAPQPALDAVLAAFDRDDVVGMDAAHSNEKQDQFDLSVRDPRFAAKVDDIARDPFITSILANEVLAKHRKALALFGVGHLYHGDGSAVGAYETTYPGRTYVIETHNGFAALHGLPRGLALESRMDRAHARGAGAISDGLGRHRMHDQQLRLAQYPSSVVRSWINSLVP